MENSQTQEKSWTAKYRDIPLYKIKKNNNNKRDTLNFTTITNFYYINNPQSKEEKSGY